MSFVFVYLFFSFCSFTLNHTEKVILKKKTKQKQNEIKPKKCTHTKSMISQLFLHTLVKIVAWCFLLYTAFQQLHQAASFSPSSWSSLKARLSQFYPMTPFAFQHTKKNLTVQRWGLNCFEPVTYHCKDRMRPRLFSL